MVVIGWQVGVVSGVLLTTVNLLFKNFDFNGKDHRKEF